MFNEIILEGRLTRNLEYLTLKNNNDPNRIGCKFSLAHDYSKGVVLFLDCVYFGNRGITNWLKQGSSVIIRGKLKYEDYQSKQDGSNKRKYVIYAEDISFSMSTCGNNKQNNNGGAPWGNNQGQAQFNNNQQQSNSQSQQWNTQGQQAQQFNNYQRQNNNNNYQQQSSNQGQAQFNNYQQQDNSQGQTDDFAPVDDMSDCPF